MAATDDPTIKHQTAFLTMLDAAFKRFGVAEGLPMPLREAVASTPRHRFVHRFRIGDGPLQDADADCDALLPVIYSDAVMTHVDAAGEKLRSSNSEPSYVLFLLHLLGVQRGQAVLEIGSGSGWLAAVMARLTGRVTGVELIPELAAQSRADLAALGAGNVTVITGDGTRGHAAGAPYDRVMITAGVWDVPSALLDQVAEGGRALVPVELRSGDGCDVTVFQRQSGTLVAERSVPGWFVPLLGQGQGRPGALTDPLPAAQASARYALPLGLLRLGGAASPAGQFRAFLGRTEPGFVAVRPDGDWHWSRPTAPFGLRDPDGSLALWQNGEILAHSGPRAAARLARSYARWAALGLPGAAAFQLEVHRASAAPAGTAAMWIETRGETALAWRLRPMAQSWQQLTGGDAETVP